MKTWRGTVVVTYSKEIEVTAETKEAAEMLMYQLWDNDGAECSECQAYDVEEVTNEGVQS